MPNKQPDKQYEIGMVGLGVMERNLLLNMVDHGFSIAGYDKGPTKVDALRQEATQHAWSSLNNNVAERAVRPLAIGRKNWLFVGSEDGGEAAAIILSLVQTCRGLGVNPREYLEDVMRRLMSHPVNKLNELLPDQWAKSRAQS